MIFDKQLLNQLYRYCYALTVHRDDAYDLLQTSVEKYLRKPPITHCSDAAYLRQIIRNQFIDQVRRKKLVGFESFDTGNDFGSGYDDSSTNDVIAINSSSLDTLLINEEQVEWIWSILNAAEREIVFLWAVEGYTAAEISADLNIPRGTILSKIHRLKKKINISLTEEASASSRLSKAAKKGRIK